MRLDLFLADAVLHFAPSGYVPQGLLIAALIYPRTYFPNAFSTHFRSHTPIRTPVTGTQLCRNTPTLVVIYPSLLLSCHFPQNSFSFVVSTARMLTPAAGRMQTCFFWLHGNCSFFSHTHTRLYTGMEC
eukprot:RCo034315